jgi:hypothetical protein
MRARSRWSLVEAIELPGVLAYWATKNEAIVNAETLAMSVNAEFEPKSKVQEGCQALAASLMEDVRSGKVSMVLEREALARVSARLKWANSYVLCSSNKTSSRVH